MTGAFESAITGLSMKSRTPFASCASIECGIAVKRIAEDHARLVMFVGAGIADMDRLRERHLSLQRMQPRPEGQRLAKR